MAKIYHIFTDTSGNAQVEEVEVTLKPDKVGKRSLSFPVEHAYLKEFPPRKSGLHTAPRRQFVVKLFGETVVETPSGYHRVMQAGDITFADDTTGIGHHTNSTEDRGSLYLPVPDEFDFKAWCAGHE